MALSILTQPPDLAYSGNPLICIAETDQPTRLRASLQVEETLFGGFSEIYSEEKPIDADGKARFDFSKVLEALQDPELPIPIFSFFFLAENSGRRYRFTISEVESGLFSSSAIKFFIRGRLRHQEFNSDFALPISAPAQLTARPIERLHQLVQFEYLWILSDTAVNTDPEVQYLVEYTDGSNASGSVPIVSFAPAPAFVPFAVQVDDNALLYSTLDPAKEIKQIRATVLGQSITMVLDFDCFDYTREFHYTNRFGGSDSLITYGIGQRSLDYERIIAQRGDIWTDRVANGDPAMPAAFQVGSVSRTQTFSVGAGFRNQAERDASLEILESESVFLREGNSLIPIIIDSDSVALQEDGDYRFGFRFNYRYAFND